MINKDGCTGGVSAVKVGEPYLQAVARADKAEARVRELTDALEKLRDAYVHLLETAEGHADECGAFEWFGDDRDGDGSPADQYRAVLAEKEAK